MKFQSLHKISIVLFISLSICRIAHSHAYKKFYLHPGAVAAKEFYFIRHGQTDSNIGKAKHYGNTVLNECGVRQVEAMVPVIKQLPIETICYSPLLRTVQTKNILNADLSIPEVKILKLKEIYSKLFVPLDNLATSGFLESSKISQKFVEQVKKGLILALQEPDPVLIVAHSGVYKAVCFLLGISSEQWQIENAEIVHFYKKDEAWKSRRLGRQISVDC